MDRSKQKQIAKYGSEAAYRAEMRRRRALVKTFYLKDNKGAAKAMAAKRWQKNETDNPGAVPGQEEL